MARRRSTPAAKEAKVQDLVTFGPLVAFFLLIVLDLVVPARAFPQIGRWRLKGLAFFALYLVIATLLPMTVGAWLGAHRLVDATGLGMLAGAGVAIVVYQLVAYWWHRALHRVPLLWRWFHQMHHSAERVDIFGAFYFHPLDMAGWTLVTSVSMVLIVGVSGEAAGLANLVLSGVVMLGHSNLRTPAWLGYLIQRPENHAVHHERGQHAYNYADISAVDMLFGTWKNPPTWESEAGFYDGASQRVGDMLLGKDVSDLRAHMRRSGSG
jgi:sterol desaturase/sphingolipid hydroxylase (fatty acid hydroxylase superfamily)